jgi:hypothetical protein
VNFVKGNDDYRLDESMSKPEITEGINTMLECLLRNDKNGCNKCKECEKIDACCFLIDSVFAYKNIKRGKW